MGGIPCDMKNGVLPTAKKGPRYSSHRPRKKRWLEWLLNFLLLGLVCLLPLASVIALTPLDYEWYVIGYLSAISLLTYYTYRRDKRCAQLGNWRTPETTLHLMEFLGGWPAAFLAQRVLRHKIRKISYQMIFWLIVVFHQWLAFDSFLGWRYVRLGYAWLQVLSHS